MTEVITGRYERQRLANIARNNAKLAELGLDSVLLSRPSKPATKKRKRARPPAVPQRRSDRGQKRPPAVYSATHAEDEQIAERARQQQQVSSGYRDATDGRWRGERFGLVEGVELGTYSGNYILACLSLSLSVSVSVSLSGCACVSVRLSISMTDVY